MMLPSLATCSFGLLWRWKDPVQESTDASRFIISEHQKCVPELISKLQMKICFVENIISAPSLFLCVCFRKEIGNQHPSQIKVLAGGEAGEILLIYSHEGGLLHCLGRHSTDREVLAHLFRTVYSSAKCRVQNQAVPMHSRAQGTDTGDKEEDFTTWSQIVVPSALTHNCYSEPCAFPTCTPSFNWAKLGLLDQPLGNQGHRRACQMCTPVCSQDVPGACPRF